MIYVLVFLGLCIVVLLSPRSSRVYLQFYGYSEDVLHFFPFVIVMSIIETSAECFLVFKKKEVF